MSVQLRHTQNEAILIASASDAGSGEHDGDPRNGTLFRLIWTSRDGCCSNRAPPETWTLISHTAQAIAGRVTFTPTEITFQNGKSLPLAPGGQMLFRPEAKQRKVMADLYRVTSQGDPALQNRNTLCKGNPIAYLIVWKSEKAGKEADPRPFGAFLRAETQRRLAR